VPVKCWLYHVPCCPVAQLYTQVEAFAAAINKLRELGFNVNTEESELVYRGTAGTLVWHVMESVVHPAGSKWAVCTAACE
jgi:hypothetical protein